MPTKRYDRIWESSLKNSETLVYTELLWSKTFGSSFVTTTKKIMDDYRASGEKYFSDFMKKNDIQSSKLRV